MKGGWVGGAGQAMVDGNNKRDLKTPKTLKPILPPVCKKNVSRFIHTSASGKPHFSQSRCHFSRWLLASNETPVSCWYIVEI